MHINSFASSYYILKNGVALFNEKSKSKDCHSLVLVQSAFCYSDPFTSVLSSFSTCLLSEFDPISTEINHKIPAGSRRRCYLCDV